MNRWQQILIDVLSALRLIDRPRFRLSRQRSHPAPNQVTSESIIVIQNHSVEKTAILRCPGLCGQRILLNLNRTRFPNWRVSTDWLGRPSLNPSVRQLNDCRCHFWIVAGNVQWCDDTPTKSAPQTAHCRNVNAHTMRCNTRSNTRSPKEVWHCSHCNKSRDALIGSHYLQITTIGTRPVACTLTWHPTSVKFSTSA